MNWKKLLAIIALVLVGGVVIGYWMADNAVKRVQKKGPVGFKQLPAEPVA